MVFLDEEYLEDPANMVGHGQAQEAAPYFVSFDHEREPQGLYQFTGNCTNQVSHVDYANVNAEAFRSNDGPSRPQSSIAELLAFVSSDKGHVSAYLSGTSKR